ncbi:hypothetical protein M5D96_003015 [Drosophila gunungcola]|uniref:Uncharacterized protein n=1 Tax=Drosophila gunungcola TaxID=103775 RepID=A0A9Q0BW17_9MUSC|nr:hypothetical protein M5D96_003015 [Drosophila gunungcola]
MRASHIPYGHGQSIDRRFKVAGAAHIRWTGINECPYLLLNRFELSAACSSA